MRNRIAQNLKPILELIFWTVLVVGLIAAAQHFNQEDLKNLLTWISGLGPWGAVTYIVLYILATLLLVPGSILTLGAGAIFGVLWGSICASIGATIGAAGAFLVGRYLARGWVEQRLEGNSRFQGIDQAVARSGWKIVGLTRLSPILPFTLLNYAFGVTQVSFKDYFFSTWIGITPGTVLYVYLGAGSLTLLGSPRVRTSLEWVWFGFGLIATGVVTIYLTKIAKKGLEDALDFH